MTDFQQVTVFSRGYNRDEVDDFFTRAKKAYSQGDGTMDETDVRAVVFHNQRGGYNTQDVDAALNRLEGAFIALKRAGVISARGEQEWLNLAYEDAKSLYPRMLRPRGQRFAHPDRWGYKIEDVDNFVNRLAKYFDGETDLTSKDIRSVTFKEAKGNKAYDEKIVDVYLERAIGVLLAVE
ncbi:DivIVA domain-containing protein [Actinotignum urinale]|uniref:DivIVA domain-containing protein n=1 Tax=Actinotignum urinale TaxID=190146 RepID=A0AAW9HTM3_9ACTO|nr:DivIVA domain-containing protein [Actinotignum urinale]MDY5129172.1 DivIVA domain-containing protein [Actinotignum urinale]MDY5132359.1 DivIVA domain-containing protein [Actinotignum urinale]MDY5151466.1 DivIVA domain-containing protein [Actinotignum urinale]MDY5154989.1 DivIVA domain-containing protein [Actinotignum urinale]MDY5160756.1 DivIVA domain-containing protein [Actinotignum urinale]